MPLRSADSAPVALHVRKFGVGRSGRGLGAAVTGVAGVVRVAVAVKRRVAGRRSARNGERDRKCARVQQERVVFRDLFGEIVLDIDAAAVDFARNSRRGDGLSVHFDVQLFVAVAVRDRGGRLLEALAAPSRQRQHDAAGAVLAALGARDLLDILIRQPYLAVRVGCGKGLPAATRYSARWETCAEAGNSTVMVEPSSATVNV